MADQPTDPAARRKRALAFALAGVDWEVIAVECGYDNRAAAIADIETALTENPIEALSDRATRNLQMARLSRLLASTWSKAINGDNRSIEVASSLVKQLMKAQGIEDTGQDKIPESRPAQSAYDELAARRPGSLGGPRKESPNPGRRRGRRLAT